MSKEKLKEENVSWTKKEDNKDMFEKNELSEEKEGLLDKTKEAISNKFEELQQAAENVDLHAALRNSDNAFDKAQAELFDQIDQFTQELHNNKKNEATQDKQEEKYVEIPLKNNNEKENENNNSSSNNFKEEKQNLNENKNDNDKDLNLNNKENNKESENYVNKDNEKSNEKEEGISKETEQKLEQKAEQAEKTQENNQENQAEKSEKEAEVEASH